jgi:hypothetical protein
VEISEYFSGTLQTSTKESGSPTREGRRGRREKMKTWNETLGALGLRQGTESAELVRRATAPARHAARVACTLAAVREFLGPDHTDAEMVAELLCDLNGIGGPFGAGGFGAATVRRPWASALGKGRRRASDGPAWMAAVESAITQIANGRAVEIDPGVSRRVVVTLSGPGDEFVEAAIDELGWGYSLAVCGLLLASGAWPGEEGAARLGERTYPVWGGTAAEWAAVVDGYAEKRAVGAVVSECREALEAAQSEWTDADLLRARAGAIRAAFCRLPYHNAAPPECVEALRWVEARAEVLAA